jgi:hypothetical protein
MTSACLAVICHEQDAADGPGGSSDPLPAFEGLARVRLTFRQVAPLVHLNLSPVGSPSA